MSNRQKKLLKTLPFILVLTRIFVSLPFLLMANVLRNPGFETGNLSEWNVTTGTLLVTNVVDGVRNGNWSARAPNVNAIVRFEQTEIPVTQNTWYRLTVHSKLIVSSGEGSIYTPYTRFYVNGAGQYYAFYEHRSWCWNEDWVVFNTGAMDTISIAIEVYTGVVWPPTTFGIAFDDISLAPYDTTRPRILSAVASDGLVYAPGIDDDDYVTIIFNEPTDKFLFYTEYFTRTWIIDETFKFINGHTWLDGSGNIESFVWNTTGDTLTINLSVNGGPPTIEVGDFFRPGRGGIRPGAGIGYEDINFYTITDESGNPVVRDLVVINGTFVGIEENPTTQQLSFRLLPNSPNPFKQMTNIRFQVPDNKENVSLKIYNVTGQLVETLINEHLSAGDYGINWDGKDALKRLVPSGIYFYRLETDDFTDTKKMLILR